MKRLIFSILTVFIFAISVASQISVKPILLGNRSHYDEDTDMLFHSLENTQSMFEKDPNALFAIRVCSIDPLPLALADAAGVSYGVEIVKRQLDYLNKLSSKNIAESNIVFLRNDKGCKFYKNTTLTEYWFVPSKADFPSFVESRNIEDISKESIIYGQQDFSANAYAGEYVFSVNGKFLSLKDGEVKLTPELYETTKNKIVEALRKNKRAYLLIKVPIYGPIKKTIAQKALQLQVFLIKNGIGSYRVFIKNCVFCMSEDATVPPASTGYPDLTIVYQN